MPDGGKIMGFVGNISAANARERRDGFVEAIKGSKVELVDTLDDNKDPSRARRNVEDAITKKIFALAFLPVLSLYASAHASGQVPWRRTPRARP